MCPDVAVKALFILVELFDEQLLKALSSWSNASRKSAVCPASSLMSPYSVIIIIITKLYLNTVKSETAAPFTGVYRHQDKTNTFILEKITIILWNTIIKNNIITFMPVTTEWLSTCAASLTRSVLKGGVMVLGQCEPWRSDQDDDTFQCTVWWRHIGST